MRDSDSQLPETYRSSRLRIFHNSLWTVGCLICSVIVLTPVVWWYVTRARLASIALEQTTALFERMQRQDYDSIERDGLVYDGYFDVLLVRDDMLGPIESFKITDTTASPLVLPFIVHVKTVRSGVAYNEIVIMHSSRGGYLQVELQADPKTENDILRETNRRREDRSSN
ncbi:MAG: hypothetical protein WD716_08555 [Fimbriimonadaceae bacterium]